VYHKIMVPLDGSQLAECVLPHVRTIARGCSDPVSIVLLRAIEPPLQHADDYTFTGDQQQREKELSDRKAASDDYLNQVAQRLRGEGMSVETQVVIGKAAESLSDFAEQNEVDLIVIATHGRSGISRWVRGSVADRILQSAHVPVMMVRATQ